MRRRGLLITFEGPEGSGKSSQGRRLAQSLRRAGHPVVACRDPGSTALGRALRRMLLHSGAALSPMAEALLFIGGRVQLVEDVIQPALRRGKVVVCDRFHDATVAYQGYGGTLNVAWLNRLGRSAIHGTMPDLTILLDVPPALGFARLRHSQDRMERKGPAFHRRVRRGYLRLAQQEPRRFAVVDAAKPPAAVQEQINAAALHRLRHRIPQL